MTEPRVHPLSDVEVEGTRALLIANTDHDWIEEIVR